MIVVAFICLGDQALVEPALIRATLVAADQQDRLASRIEGKGDTPYLAAPREP
jgi:hypothetical protein